MMPNAMPIHADLAHKMPGRVRLRIARAERAHFSRLSGAAQDIGTIRAVKPNAATGSIVLEFNGSFDDLAAELRRRGVTIDAPQEPKARAAASISGVKPLRLVTGRNIDTMFMLGSILAVAGAVQFSRGKILTPAASLFWSAMQAFRYSARRRPSQSV
jgi:hypothetical protein